MEAFSLLSLLEDTLCELQIIIIHNRADISTESLFVCHSQVLPLHLWTIISVKWRTSRPALWYSIWKLAAQWPLVKWTFTCKNEAFCRESALKWHSCRVSNSSILKKSSEQFVELVYFGYTTLLEEVYFRFNSRSFCKMIVSQHGCCIGSTGIQVLL